MITAIEKPMNDDQPEASRERKALVDALTARVKDAKTFWGPQFERIREDIRFAGGDQWQDAEEKMADAASDKFMVNFVQRELNQQVSAIYAKNPTIICERRKRMEYTVWDGDDRTLQMAQQVLATNAPMIQAATSAKQLVQQYDAERSSLPMANGLLGGEPPQITQARQVAGSLPAEVIQAQAIVRDFMAGVARKALFEKISTTAELVFNHQLDEQQPDFESQMKHLIVREKTTGAGFVAVKYQRVNETVATSSATTADLTHRINRVKQLMEEQGEDELEPAQKEQLALELAALQKEIQGQVQPKAEGIILDFKPTTSVIVDPKCRNLFQFLGADWIAEELMLTPEAIEQQWGVDVRDCAVTYQHGQENKNQSNLNTKAGGVQDRDNQVSGNWPDKATACVWIIYDKNDQMRYVVCDGYEDFLEEPEAPWPAVKGFWPIVALKLSLLEIEENHPKAGLTVYGTSAVRLMKPMQEEMNRTQEALREHRIANRPGYLCGKDTFDNNDMRALADRAAHDCVPLNNIPPGGDVSKVMAPIPTVPIDARLYETGSLMQQVLLVTGMQQANMGAQGSGEKATGQAIAEQSRIVGVSSEVDSLNKFLSELARITGEMLFSEMSLPTVQEIAGPGAAWPNDPDTRKQINDALILKIEAGSMGRPNRAMEIANLQQMMPQLIQLAQLRGLPLDPLVKYAAKVLEFDFDVEDWLASAQPLPPQPPAGALPGSGPAPNAPVNPAVVDPNAPPTAPGMGMVNTMLNKAQNTVG